MDITDVKVFPVEEDKLKAYATVTFDHCFIVRDLKVIAGTKGFFIAMPSKKRKDGTFRDIAHPLNSETRKMIEDAVLAEFEKEQAAVQAGKPPAVETEPAPEQAGAAAAPAAVPTDKEPPRPAPEAPEAPEDPEKAFGYKE